MTKKRKILIAMLSLACAGCLGAAAACGGSSAPEEIENGGFEKGDLTGWTVEWGDAFDDDCVRSEKTFVFDEDPTRPIDIKQQGNWYLSGKRTDNAHRRTGAIRSSEFAIPDDGVISFKLAGGALFNGSDGLNEKQPEKLCYLGVYLAENGQMIAKQTNTRFLKHSLNYVPNDDYEAGIYYTDNFYGYTLDLSAYKGKTAYIRIVDEDAHPYYGYIAVDDIRIGADASAQAEGEYREKKREYVTEAAAPTKYDVANGGFETGSLAGWTVVSGEAFANEGVNSEDGWWNENLDYNRDGNYHYGYYKPEAVGVMRSTDFELGGSGYITYKLGGCQNNNTCYIKFMVREGSGVKEIARYSNFKYKDQQFPYVENGLRLLNLNQYYVDFSNFGGIDYRGKTMYIEVVDEDSENLANGLKCITLDSVKTYWEQAPVFNSGNAYECMPDPNADDVAPDNPSGKTYQVANGTFESGNLDGWTVEGTAGGASDNSLWWDAFTLNKKGNWLYVGDDAGKGSITSSVFEVGGVGYMTFRMGAGKNPKNLYISLLDADDGDREVARFGNLRFVDNGTAAADIGVKTFLGNMVEYVVKFSDIGIENGAHLKIRIVDDQEGDWGFVEADSFITYYTSVSNISKSAWKAVNILPAPEADPAYQIANGGFETGDMTGWTKLLGTPKDNPVTLDRMFWNEMIPLNVGGAYHFHGFGVTASEGMPYTFKSGNFTLAGSGYISFKMGGRTAVLEVYRASDDSCVARFINTAFIDLGVNVSTGSRLGTMTRFFANLKDYGCADGDELYIVIGSRGYNVGEVANWGVAFFDDIITYYAQAPDVHSGYDTVEYCTNPSRPHYHDVLWKVAERAYAVEVEGTGVYYVVGGASLTLPGAASYADPDREFVCWIVDGEEKSAGSVVSGINADMSVSAKSGLKAPVKVADGITQNMSSDGTYEIDVEQYITTHKNQVTVTVDTDTYVSVSGPVDGKITVAGKNAGVGTAIVTVACLDVSVEFTFELKTAGSAIARKDVIEVEELLDLFTCTRGKYTIDLAANVDHASLVTKYIVKINDDTTGVEVIPDGDSAIFEVNKNTLAFNDKVKEVVLHVTSEVSSGDPVTYTYKFSMINSTKYQAVNGGFESGDLTGWELVSQNGTLGEISGANDYWDGILHQKEGTYFFYGKENGPIGTLTSSEFVLGGSGVISFRLGTAAHPEKQYVEVYKKVEGEDDVLVARYTNPNFVDAGAFDGNPDKNSGLTLIKYQADLSDYIGETLYVKVVDEWTEGGFGFVLFDDLKAFYLEGAAPGAEYNVANNVLPAPPANG